jgi:hypothetical protein
MKNYEERRLLTEQKKWLMLAWDGDEDERKRKFVMLQCTLDSHSFMKLPYHESLAKWRPKLTHEQCHHPKPKRRRERTNG